MDKGDLVLFGIALDSTGEDVVDRIAKVDGGGRGWKVPFEGGEGVEFALAIEVGDLETLAGEPGGVGFHGGPMEDELLSVHGEGPVGIGAEEEGIFEEVNIAFSVEGRVFFEKLMGKNEGDVHGEESWSGRGSCLIIFGPCDFQER